MTGDWLRVLNPDVVRGRFRHALFDFDGTISVIRQGWEGVMAPLMVEMICDGREPTPEIEAEVHEFIDRSTGILTIEQMQWLEEAVRRYGFAKKVRTARDYKRIYIERLAIPVQERLGRLERGEVTQDGLMMAGARPFVEGLSQRGLTLYVASGTDHQFVAQEIEALGMAHFFSGGMYGSRDSGEMWTKERVIAGILADHSLHGAELLVVGDGPVEIRQARAQGAVALGVATDEIKRSGWNEHKIARLTNAGADLLAPDFSQHAALLGYLFPN
jgi:phosphoglycolate phosphatase-like HAD superfamily hydrolase